MSLKAVHYINQFYAGIGGETMADTGFGILEEKKGPALGLEQLWNGEMTISKVVYCGDNYVNTDENYGEVKEKLAKVIREEKPLRRCLRQGMRLRSQRAWSTQRYLYVA